jgi:hypothetical protein
MSNLADIEQTMRQAINTAPGRDALTKYIIANDYVARLCPLVQMAEDFESIHDLHRLCSIMKSVILLNDNTIMEMVVRDDLVQGVVGALECKFGQLNVTWPTFNILYKMIPTSPHRKQTIANIWPTQQDTKKLSRSKNPLYSKRYIIPIDYSTSKTLFSPEYLTILLSPSSTHSYSSIKSK